MKNTDNVKIFNIVSAIVFVLSFGLCAWFGWRDVVNGLFSPSGENVGEIFKMPADYTVVCFVFLVVLCALVILGTVKRGKVMLWISGSYTLLFIIGFILLGALTTGNITNEVLFNIVTYFLTAVLIPVYGVIWQINLWFFVILIPLIIVNIVGLVNAYKK